MLNTGSTSADSPLVANQGPPLWLLAELTYRCPLQCPYCSNPLDYANTQKELSTQEWVRVLQAANPWYVTIWWS